MRLCALKGVYPHAFGAAACKVAESWSGSGEERVTTAGPVRAMVTAWRTDLRAAIVGVVAAQMAGGSTGDSTGGTGAGGGAAASAVSRGAAIAAARAHALAVLQSVAYDAFGAACAMLRAAL